jgi:hypothetical protein
MRTFSRLGPSLGPPPQTSPAPSVLASEMAVKVVVSCVPTAAIAPMITSPYSIAVGGGQLPSTMLKGLTTEQLSTMLWDWETWARLCRSGSDESKLVKDIVVA